jgi:hypothetical protein
MTRHVDNIYILVKLQTSIGSHGRSWDGDSIDVVEEGIGFGRFPPCGRLGRSARE